MAIVFSLAVLLLSSAMAQYENYPGFRGQLDLGEEYQHLDHHPDHEVDYHAHPKYTFDYSVKDPHTGDDKEHWETRDGDKVKGSYSLIETDGTKRIVEYEADDKNGFNAVVHKIGTPKEELKFHREPLNYPHEYNEGGFMPIVGGYQD